MKVNIFLTVVAALLSALLGYWAFYIAQGAPQDMLCGIGSSICFLATLVPIMGLQYTDGRLGVNIRIFSLLFFILFIISNFCFAGYGIKMPLYLILNGVALLIYLAVLYKMMGTK